MTDPNVPAIALLDVPRETIDQLTLFVELVRREAERQNLISAATLETIWTRHVLDSLQLIRHAPSSGDWIDIGTGAGFPGLVVAIASPAHRLHLVEPRALRAIFLERAVAELGLADRVRVFAGKVERFQDVRADVISARAVSRIDRLFLAASHVARESTVWLLPKGRSVRDELATARQTWQGRFRLEPSITDADAAIVVATGVQRRTKR